MGKTRPPYPPEFRSEAVKLYKTSDKSISELAKDLGVSAPSLTDWIKRAEIE